MMRSLPTHAKRYSSLLLAAALLLVASSVRAQTNDAVKTLAGKALVAGGMDGVATNARFNDPTGLAMDPAGNIYVADNRNHTIRKLTPGGSVITIAGKTGQPGSLDATGTNALFNSPSGIALDAGGNLYVTDTGNHTIRRITPAGVVSTVAGFAGDSGFTNATGNLARFNSPLGIAVGPGGGIYVADSGNHVIRKITPTGAVTTLAGSPGVWGTNNGTGGAARFNCPVGVALDSHANVFVSDANNHTLRRITQAGVVSTWAGLPEVDGTKDGTGTAARFGKPAELKFDRNDNLFVVDSFNHTIRRVDTNAVVTTLAGLSDNGGSDDGHDGQARFFNPYGIAVDHNGNLRVSDTYNQTVRFIYAPMFVSILRNGPEWSITWQAVPGNRYQVQYSNAGGAWQNLGGVVTATSPTGSQTDAMTAEVASRFYRVLLLP